MRASSTDPADRRQPRAWRGWAPAAFVAAALAATACSAGSSKKGDKNDANATGAADANPSASPAPAASAAPAKPEIKLTSGLPTSCTYARSAANAAQGCFTCSPHALPRTTCVDTKADFDPAKACSYAGQVVTCDVGAAKPLTLDGTELTSLEKTYDALPIIVVGAKALLTSKIGDAKIKTLVFGLLDALEANKKALFVGGDTAPFTAKVRELVAAAKPDVAAADLDKMTQALTDALATLDASRKSGTLDQAGIVDLAVKALDALPPSVVPASLTQSLDLDELVAMFKNGGGDLASLIAILGGGGSTGGDGAGLSLTDMAAKLEAR
jgi:hypothetical protein